jgi:hypothetical protein
MELVVLLEWLPTGSLSYLFSYFILFVYFSFIVLGVDTLWHLQRFLQFINYVVLQFTPSATPLYLPLP